MPLFLPYVDCSCRTNVTHHTTEFPDIIVVNDATNAQPHDVTRSHRSWLSHGRYKTDRTESDDNAPNSVMRQLRIVGHNTSSDAEMPNKGSLETLDGALSLLS
jgi:hypothetical protein